MAYGRKKMSGAYSGNSKKGGYAKRNPLKGKPMPRNQGNEVKPSHKGYAK